MSSRRRMLLLVALVLAATTAFRLGVDAWGRSHNAGVTTAAKAELAAERARIEQVRLPVAVAGTARDVTCDLGELRLPPDNWMAVRSAAGKPWSDVSDEVAKTVREARPEIAKIGEALRCTRLDPAVVLAMEDASTSLIAALIVDGHLSIRDGAIDPGTTRYLEAARLGANAGAANASMGWFSSEQAFLAIARLLATREEAPVARIASFLDALEPVLPSSRDFVKHVRLFVAQVAANAHRESTAPLSAPKYSGLQGTQLLRARTYVLLYPQSLRYAQALDVLNDLYARAEALPDGASMERRAFESRLLAATSTTSNPFVYDLAGVSYDPSAVTGYAAFALARAVARVEALRRAASHAPASLPTELWAHDPATDAAPFGYEPTTTGYRIWSVGRNGKDDHGGDDDVVAERR